MKNFFNILRGLSILYFLSYALLIITTKLNIVSDTEGLGLLWGMTFGLLFYVVIVYLIFAIFLVKDIKKIDAFIISAVLVMFAFIFIYRVLGERQITEQIMEIDTIRR